MKFRSYSEVEKWASRLVNKEDGSREIIRFSSAQIAEHWVLIVSFTLLAVTGLVQRYADIFWVSWLINNVMGGINGTRSIHHLAAIVFIFQSVYHVWKMLEAIVVYKDIGFMLPAKKDLNDIWQMIKYNLGKADSRPKFDRYTIEEKIEYWALLWGTAVMIVTGLVQWFPAFTTRYFPGVIVPISRVVHSWEALLATLAILLWHTYHAVIKEKNNSIFSGRMSEGHMEENHALELERILEANEIKLSLPELKKKSGQE